eukprot:JP436851.1.p1 GENE.JP436851.1~~JP436851.1.p1  ORF type:complete len:209 (+),score=87.06 JP436851.1:1-627(+)
MGLSGCGLPSMFQKVVVVDCRAHLLGRLCATVAKELLNGQHVVLVRCEQVNITGSLIRNRYKYLRFLDKRHLTNPTRGPYHYRAPSKIVWRTIRGMVPHKSARGAAALERLKVFDGVPPPYDKTKKVVIPDAFRVTRLRPTRKFCVLGRLSAEVGWNYGGLVDKLEDKRRTRAAAYYQRKKALIALRKKAEAKADLKEVTPVLAAYGY